DTIDSYHCDPSSHQPYCPPRPLPSFPTRRSSDLSARPRHVPKASKANSSILLANGLVRESRPGIPVVKRSISSPRSPRGTGAQRSEEHTSELQSRFDLVCRLLLEKKKKRHTDLIS